MIRFLSSTTTATLKTSRGKKSARGNFGDGAKYCRFSCEGVEIQARWENNRISIEIFTENEIFVEDFSLEFKIKTLKPASAMTIWSESFGEITSSDSPNNVPGMETRKQNRNGSWAMWIADSPKSEGIFLNQIPPIKHFVHYKCWPFRSALKVTWTVNCTVLQNEQISLSPILTQRGDRESLVHAWRKQYFGTHSTVTIEKSRKGWIGDKELQSPKDILACAKKLSESRVPLDWLAIGPGYAKSVGDWLDPLNTFRNKMGNLSRSIAELQFKPGICIAPFLVSKMSEIANIHPDWLVTNDRNIPVKLPGYINSRDTSYVLDITNPSVRTHIQQVFGTMRANWEISVFITDRLSDVVCTGRRMDNRIPCGQLMAMAIGMIRERIGRNTLLVGRNMPLLAAPGMSTIQTQSGTPFQASMPQFLSCVSSTMLYRSAWNGNTWLNACDSLSVDFIANPVTDAQKTLLQVIQLAAGAVIITGNLKNMENPALKELNSFLRSFDSLHAESLQFSRPEDEEELLIVKSNRGWIAVFNFSPLKKSFCFRREVLKNVFNISNAITTGKGTVFNSPEIEILLPPWGHRLFKLV